MTIVGVDVDAPDFTVASVIGADPSVFNRWMSGDEIDQSPVSGARSIDSSATNHSVADRLISESRASDGSAEYFVGSTATSEDTIEGLCQ